LVARSRLLRQKNPKSLKILKLVGQNSKKLFFEESEPFAKISADFGQI
jgi:hypothetical protein